MDTKSWGIKSNNLYPVTHNPNDSEDFISAVLNFNFSNNKTPEMF